MCGILAILGSREDPVRVRAQALKLSRSLRHRGPDWNGIFMHSTPETGELNVLAHERLAIVDLESGAQPLFNESRTVALCVNGEIYNHAEVEAATRESYKFLTKSDCECIIALYEKHGPVAFIDRLDGIFAFILYDIRKNSFVAARDPVGVCSMYVGWHHSGSTWFASEMKALVDCTLIREFPPGHFFSKESGDFIRWYNPVWLDEAYLPSSKVDYTSLRESLEQSVIRQMMADVPIGVLLSGGLDSSIIASIAGRYRDQVQRTQNEYGFSPVSLLTFSIGLEGSPDLKWAKKVASFIGSKHHSFTFTLEEGIDALHDVINHIETYDVTTVRASTPMFLMARRIKAMGIKVVLSGEGSDELFGGYLYFHKAPSPEEFNKELVRKISALSKYDCLRANKATAAWGVETRVPFLDRQLMDTAMSIDPRYKMILPESQQRLEKYILRQAFNTPDRPYLPEDVLWRQKEQFSDGVGYGWIDSLKKYAERTINDHQFKMAPLIYSYNTPTTKEAYLYRTIFDSLFGKESCALTVPSGPSIACSTSAALEWDKDWENLADPSGRFNILNMTSKTSQPSQSLINRLRELVKSLIHCQDYESASFWAEKVLFMTNDPNDAYERARCLYNLKQYHRAAHTIKSRNLHQANLACLYLAAQCHYMERDYKEANQLLDSPLITAASTHNDSSVSIATPTTSINRHSSRLHQSGQQQQVKFKKQETSPGDRNVNRWLGAIHLLKGKLYECSDNRQMAQASFKEALLNDIFCFEAYTCLTRHHMLSIEEEDSLLNELDIDSHFANDQEMGEFVKLFYTLQGKKYHKPTNSVLPAQLEYLATNVDVETALAERHYLNCDYHSAYELSTTILEKDVHHLECLPVYISSLMEIDKPIKLFDIAHQLVDLYPESAVSWFAVGCYYLMINKIEPARRYLSKATSLDNVFGQAWLVYGHSFAVEREHDQAMAAYFRAYHLMRGCHLPLLFIGVEYGRANDCRLAAKFVMEARRVAPEDPFVLHEYGVVHYRNSDFKAALVFFKEAESILRSSDKATPGWTGSERFKQKWEPLLNNIGHTLRKLRRYDEAIEYHNQALTLVQANASTYSALGFLYYLKSDWDQALENLNNALSIKYNDSISSTLLDKTIEKYNKALEANIERIAPSTETIRPHAFLL